MLMSGVVVMVWVLKCRGLVMSEGANERLARSGGGGGGGCKGVEKCS